MFKDKTARENIERLHSQMSDRFNYQYDRMEKLDEKLNLILDHLKLKYVPETEKKEPAKLITKEKVITSQWCTLPTDFGNISISGGGGGSLPVTVGRTKRKYTKRKK